MARGFLRCFRRLFHRRFAPGERRLATILRRASQDLWNVSTEDDPAQVSDEVRAMVHAATALGCSVRTVAYLLPADRRRLADILDRLDLL